MCHRLLRLQTERLDSVFVLCVPALLLCCGSWPSLLSSWLPSDLAACVSIEKESFNFQKKLKKGNLGQQKAFKLSLITTNLKNVRKV